MPQSLMIYLVVQFRLCELPAQIMSQLLIQFIEYALIHIPEVEQTSS
jgi:hypothetical protein